MSFDLRITTLEEFIQFMQFIFPDRIITAQVAELKEADAELTAAIEKDVKDGTPSN